MRKKSRRHKQLEILTYRYDLSEEDLIELENLRKGYEGELTFDKVLEDEFGDVDFIHIKDYCFKIQRGSSVSTKSESSIDREIQLDNIIIAGDRMITFEVKNYSFDLKYDEGHWAYLNGRKFSDPLIQIRRQQDALQELVEEPGFTVKVFSTIVFINPDQTIYNLPENPEIIIRSNLLKKLKQVLRENRNDYSKMIKYMEARRLPESQYQGEVGVLFEELKTGVFCGECGERLHKRSNYNYFCESCDRIIPILTVVKRLIYEIGTLNMNWKITASILHKYSKESISESCMLKYRKAGKIKY